MKLEDLEHLLMLHDGLVLEGFRTDDFAASLVIDRHKPPTGYCIRVNPFGNCRILNVQAKEGRIQICFTVSRKQLMGAIAKIKRELSITQSNVGKSDE